MEPKHTISAVIITFNEERNIIRCLNSIIQIVDEIIVVDSFSTDQTRELCKKYPVKFTERKWDGYSATKNFANSLATCDYILSLDADEALSPVIQEQLQLYKYKGFDAQAYRFNRLTNYCGKFIHHCGWYPDQKIRLWKNGVGHWEGHIHEELILQSSVQVKTMNGDILHYSYYSINEHIAQMMKFTDMMATDILISKKTVSASKLIISPLIKFIKSYLIQGGFRDGFYGLVICILSGVATFLKYAKARQLSQQNILPQS